MKRINVKGPIITNDDKWIYDWLEMESTAPKDITDQLPATGEDVEVVINSGGGDVYSGSEIYTELKGYTGSVIVKIVGVAASAASVIAMAGDKVMISPTAQMMIHNVSTALYGDHQALDKESEILQSHDKSIASAYEMKTGKSIDELLGLMGDETWMNAQSAVDNGFADEVMFQNEAPRLVAAVQTPLLPKNVVDKVREMKKQPKEPTVKVDLTGLKEIVNEAIKENMKPKEPEVENNSPYSRFFF